MEKYIDQNGGGRGERAGRDGDRPAGQAREPVESAGAPGTGAAAAAAAVTAAASSPSDGDGGDEGMDYGMDLSDDDLL